ncbi:membrane protein required for colicin V production [Lysobacter enzymogenes]|jgi:membrane protein required for colicin V production|uniref:Colicin V production protein n=1 Tax=Lysobacter enzymogenes TaxID=69 RepID=A0AAU9AMZ6_LYSEN|nr:CvpA family protein [Lysobacter enzymogenes]BAV99092.1 colicin V production protein [Lysobacter enzymogenes]
MTALDWGLLLIVALSALLGMARGLIGVAVSLGAWLLAGLGAFLFGGEVARGLSDSGVSWGSYIGGYTLCFAAIWLTVSILGWVIRTVAHSYGLSEMDRLMGLGLGTLRGLIFACALLVVLAMSTLPRERTWRESSVAKLLMPGAHLMRSALPDAIARKVDLEGRGGSLQETVQAEAGQVEKNLKGKMKSTGSGLTGGFGGLPNPLGGLSGGQGMGGDPAQVQPEALPEPQSRSRGGGGVGGLTDLLPGAMRDLLPQQAPPARHGDGARAPRGAEAGRIRDDGRPVDANNDDAYVR